MNNSRANQQFSYDEIFNSEARCDQTEILHCYFQGLLLEDERKRFETHLAECESCMKSLAELHDSETAIENTILNAKHADKIFQDNRVRFEAELKRKYGETVPALTGVRLFRFPTFVNAMLVVAIVILLYPSYQGFVLQQENAQLRNELELQRDKKEISVSATPQEKGASVEPTISASLIFPVRLERDTETKRIQLAFDQTRNTHTLVFSMPGEDFDSYLFEITRGNQTIWQSRIPSDKEQASQLITMQLREASLQSGRFLLRISGQTGGNVIQLTQFELMIEKDEP